TCALPIYPYGWSKHLLDRRVSRILDAADKDVNEPVPPQHVGLKFFNVYGPNEYHKDDQMSVICKLYPQVAAGASARLFKSAHPDYEDGGQLRDFIYVKDCVDVMCWLHDNPQVSGLYNVGTGKARSFKDLAMSTFIAAQKEPKIQYMDMPEALKGKYQYFTQASMDKLKKQGYDKPFTSLEEGVRDYVQNYMATSDPYR
ncbi:MAG: NAD-dependent epimerase/dehydratase family protein, partial [Pseudobdellovibrionaceae bacterium]